jgi:TM2 domain-containing membrane protein YozV
MAGRGSTGNVIAGIASFFIPGLGQLVQGRILAALFMFLLSGVIWLVSFGTLGWIGHIIAAVEAALHDPYS